MEGKPKDYTTKFHTAQCAGRVDLSAAAWREARPRKLRLFIQRLPLKVTLSPVTEQYYDQFLWFQRSWRHGTLLLHQDVTFELPLVKQMHPASTCIGLYTTDQRGQHKQKAKFTKPRLNFVKSCLSIEYGSKLGTVCYILDIIVQETTFGVKSTGVPPLI